MDGQNTKKGTAEIQIARIRTVVAKKRKEQPEALQSLVIQKQKKVDIIEQTSDEQSNKAV